VENKFPKKQNINIAFFNRHNVKYEVILTCCAYDLLPLMFIYQWLLIACHISPGTSLKRQVEYIQQYTTGILGGILSHCTFLLFSFYIPFFLLFQIFFSFFKDFFSFFLPPSNLTLELALRLSHMPKF